MEHGIFTNITNIFWVTERISVTLKGFYLDILQNIFYDHMGLRRFLKKLKIELPYDPAIPLLDIYSEKTIIQKETCTTMFNAALFTIARTWKQPKCPSTDEWIKKM